MIFDVYDFEFLRLCGLCRYVPTGLKRKFNVPYFDAPVISTLRNNGYIKMQTDKKSYKLTFEGRKILADMGYTFPEDVRMDLKRKIYLRKMKNALWNITLHLAGINVYLYKTNQLAGMDTGYVSSLTLRSDDNIRVLAGTRFLGILKMFDKVYIPYYVEGSDDWIVPKHEEDIFKSQISSLQSAKNIEIILTGDTLEELWENIHPPNKSEIQGRGMKRIDEALEELGCDYSLVPVSSEGVIQLRLMKIYRYREKIAKMLGCNVDRVYNLSECDGFKDNVPYIVAVDFNIKRILRALKQVEKYNKNITPKIYCLPFQKETMKKLMKKYRTQAATVVEILKSPITNEAIQKDASQYNSQSPYVKEGGAYVSANQRKVSKANIEEL